MTLPSKTWSVRKTACTADLSDAKPGRAFALPGFPFRMQLFGVGLRHELALHEVALVIVPTEAGRERQHPVARFGPGVGAEVGLQALLRLHAVKIRREIVRIRKVVAQQQVLVRVRIGREDLINEHPVRKIDIDVAVRLKDLGVRKSLSWANMRPLRRLCP